MLETINIAITMNANIINLTAVETIQIINNYNYNRGNNGNVANCFVNILILFIIIANIIIIIFQVLVVSIKPLVTTVIIKMILSPSVITV